MVDRVHAENRIKGLAVKLQRPAGVCLHEARSHLEACLARPLVSAHHSLAVELNPDDLALRQSREV